MCSFKCISTHIVNTYEVLSDHHKCFTFGSHNWSFTSMINEVFFSWQTYLLFSFMTIAFEIVHTWVTTQNADALLLAHFN